MMPWKTRLIRAALIVAFFAVCYLIVQLIVYPVRWFGAEYGWQGAWLVAIPIMVALVLFDRWMDRGQR